MRAGAPGQKRYVLPDSDPALQEYFRHDVADAKKLLDAAGFDYNQTHEMKFSNRPEDAALAGILQAQFQRGGVKLKLTQQDLVTWLITTLSQSQFHLTCFRPAAVRRPGFPAALPPRRPEVRHELHGLRRPEGRRPRSSTPRKELDVDARIKKVQDAQRAIINAWSPMLNIYSPIGYGGRYSYVKGSISGRGSLGLFNRTTWLDKA